MSNVLSERFCARVLRPVSGIVALLAVAVLATVPAQARFTQQDKLVGSGAVGNAGQGSSVALSADGNTALVGGSADVGLAGAAWVFGRPGITGISPSADTVDGGTSVTIVGENFFDVTGVTFSGAAATDVVALDAETVIATTPPHAKGKVNVTVSTVTGFTTAKGAYTYQALPTVTLPT